MKTAAAFCEAAVVHAPDGFYLSTGTLVLTIIMELFSLDTVKGVMNQPGGGMPLYGAAIAANLRNHFIFGWPIYSVAAALFCRPNVDWKWSDRMGCVMTILMIHSVFFYVAHRAFHSSPTLYQYHRFHHRFNIHVPPMAANAVSPTEYIVAYILPFTVAMPFLRPDPISLRLSVSIVSITNVMIHFPKISTWSKNVPAWWVATHDHLEHHRRLNCKYAAPTFNVDFFVHCLEGVSSRE